MDSGLLAGMIEDISANGTSICHDWGAFPKHIQKSVEHAVRSRRVVESAILPHLDLTAERAISLPEAIELHDYRDVRPTRSIEALLLREADMLEFLGMIGMAREFARGPKNVETCYKRIISRRYGIQGRFNLPRAQELVQVRLEQMERFLQWLLEESFGTL
jgi:uncharacterized protein